MAERNALMRRGSPVHPYDPQMESDDPFFEGMEEPHDAWEAYGQPQMRHPDQYGGPYSISGFSRWHPDVQEQLGPTMQALERSRLRRSMHVPPSPEQMYQDNLNRAAGGNYNQLGEQDYEDWKAQLQYNPLFEQRPQYPGIGKWPGSRFQPIPTQPFRP